MMESASLFHSTIPPIRVRAANARPVRVAGDFVLYWMTAFRRTRYNFALQRAVEWANQLGKPLLVLESLRIDYPWASDRFHRFIMDGMADNLAAFAGAGIVYYPYIEPLRGAGTGLLPALAGQACIVIADDYPVVSWAAAQRAATRRVDVAMEVIDSNGIHALAGPGRAFETAFSFRRWLQHNLLEDLVATPQENALLLAPGRTAAVPHDVLGRWPAATAAELAHFDLGALAIDHGVATVSRRGGNQAASEQLAAFIEHGLRRFAAERNHPDSQATSLLSPYLHFGHLSAHEVFTALGCAEGWSIGRISAGGGGRRAGFWGMTEGAEAFLDQLITWRELGFNFCRYRPDYDRFESLPSWARNTLERHQRDPRRHAYSLGQLERGETGDLVWNAAQAQLVRDGLVHNYLRMVWGKRILEWAASPRDALDVMIRLNNKYALDGCDPNSYSGIFWTLGRYDRAWGPERPIFGTVRYMSSENTVRKLKLRGYLARYGTEAAG